MAYSHDIFLSHASEDKETFVEELYNKLTEAKYKVWYDKKELDWGDNLDVKIQEGLKASQYGIVVISNNYFAKHKEWTFMEFEKILTRENILPILHGIDMLTIKNNHLNEYEQIKKWLAISSDKGIDYIVQQAKRKIDNLKSEKGIDYIKLRDLLAAKRWKEAHEETYHVMIQAVGKTYGNYFTPHELLNFPCTDLRTIDDLWVKYSNQRFGFSVQKKIYLSVGGKADGKYYEKAWEKFGDSVGWRVASSWISASKVTFDTSAQMGHLPAWGLLDIDSSPSTDSSWEKLLSTVGELLYIIGVFLNPKLWVPAIYYSWKEEKRLKEESKSKNKQENELCWGVLGGLLSHGDL